MKLSQLKHIIKEALDNLPTQTLEEGPMGAAKACKACLEKGCKCLVSGTPSDPTVECVRCPEITKTVRGGEDNVVKVK
jgi:hypothetical protein|tara:strand:+ start:122 stop:355 length:234 start_codon:yes stop_codon:yes gene_type:complete